MRVSPPWGSRLPFPTKFTTTVAVDTWDAHFRWRLGGELRDRTIDATWRRVASAVAGAETGDAETWEERFVEAFQGWRLVPDPQLLKWAGTGRSDHLPEAPQATLNLGSFVVHPLASRPYFDYDAFAHTARLAVRFVDDAALARGSMCRSMAVGVGMMGFADALAALGWPYMSELACDFAYALGKSLSAVCLEPSSLLLEQRGSHAGSAEGEHGQRCTCGGSSSIATPHPRMTAIHSQPLIALLANDASDALDPRCAAAASATSDWEIARQADAVGTQQLLMQQLKLRGRLQPWIDAPIDYPLLHDVPVVAPEVVLACNAYARQLKLPEPRFRRSRGPILGLA